MSKKKGITLIEIIITLGIAGIIIPAVFSFYMSHYKSVDKNSVKSELQFQAQVFKESINKYCMESSGISAVISDNGEDILDLDGSDGIEIGTICMKSEGGIFRISLNEGQAFYSDDDGEKNIGKYIKSIKVKPIEASKSSISDINGLAFDVHLEKDGIIYDTSFDVSFRNFKAGS